MTDDAATTAQERARQVTVRHGVPVTAALGQEVLHVDHLRYLDVVDALRDDGFDMLIDLTAVDYLLRRDRPLPEGVPRARFEVVVNLLSMQERQRVRVRAQVPERHPVLPSLYSRFPAAEAAEREVFDMFGIGFEGHPDLTRILMPEDWDGHPLRKDYGVGTIPVQFKGAPRAR